MDIIYIRDLRVDTVIGIYDWERRIRQTVRIDLDVAADTRSAAASDNITHTLSYQEIAECVAQLVTGSELELLEALAEKIAERVLSEFDTSWLRLTVGKPGAVAGAREVGVVIERGQRKTAGSPERALATDT